MRLLRDKAGFTLIELVIVIILVGILAAVVAPKMNTDAAIVPPAADVVASDIQYTKMYAMTNNVSSCINLGVNQATYNYAAVCTGVACATCSGGTTRDLTKIGPNVTVSSTLSPLAFNSLGEPYGLTTTAATITVQNGSSDNQKSLTVYPYTGKVQ